MTSTSASEERFVADLAQLIDPADPASLVFDLSTYQQFDAEIPVVTLAYARGGLGIVVWNLEPGQENDYHRHPTTEHLHVIVEGQAEYTLAGHAPVQVGVGQAVMVPAEVPHGIRNTGTERCSYIAITSPGDYQKILVERPA